MGALDRERAGRELKGERGGSLAWLGWEEKAEERRSRPTEREKRKEGLGGIVSGRQIFFFYLRFVLPVVFISFHLFAHLRCAYMCVSA